MPEVAVIGLPETDEGEIAGRSPLLEKRVSSCDAVIAGPAMSCRFAAGDLVDWLVAEQKCSATIVLDAAALMDLPSRAAVLQARSQPAILTPHVGEMAGMLACDAGEIERDRPQAVCDAAQRFGAVVVLKGATSLIAAPGAGAGKACQLFSYAGGGVGLATGGSGDVLAGIAAGLSARGADPLQATLWAVWLHGEAGRRCAEQFGPLGFLARELLTHMPPLMRAL